MNVSFRSALLVAASTYVCMVPGYALAQDSADDGSTDQEQSASQADTNQNTIIVTARRRDESLQDAPLAISALGSQELENKVILEVNDLGKTVPSLTTLQQATGAAGLYLQLRGLIQTDTAAFQAGSVGVYQDDIYIGGAPIAGQLLNITDLERVEVLKGPQGTLYGRNVTGGVMKFVTKRPTDEFEGYAKLGYGNYDRKLAEAMINAPLGTGVALRLNGQYEDRDGYSHDVVNDRDLEAAEKFTIRGGLEWEVSPDFNVFLQGSYGEYRGTGADVRTNYVDPTNFSALANFMVAQGINGITAGTLAPLIFGGTDEDVAAAGAAYGAAVPAALALIDEYANASRDNARQYPGLQTSDYGELGLAGLTLTYDVTPDVTLKSVTAYANAYRRSFFTVGGDAYTSIYNAQTGRVSQWTQEFQATGSAMDDKLIFATGLFLLDQKITDDRDPSSIDGVFPYFLGQRGLGLTSANYSLNDIRVRSFAPYAQVSYEIVPNVNITGGLRYTKETFKLRSSTIVEPNLTNGMMQTCNSPAPTTAATPLDQCFAEAKTSFDNVSYTAGADWSITPDVLIYVRTGRGFKSGGLNPFIDGGNEIAPFDPEQNTDYEIGFKSELANRMVRLNVAYYHTDYKDIQRTTTQPNSDNTGLVTGVLNAASATIDGVEGELNVNPIPGLNFGGTFAYTDAKYKNYTTINPAFPDGIQDLSDQPFYTLPKWQYTLSASYAGGTSWGGYRTSLNWSGKSGVEVGAVDVPQSPTSPVVPKSALFQDGFGLLSASLAFDIDDYDMTIAFWGRNILDKRYKESGTCLVSVGLGSCFTSYGAPATYGADVTIRF